MTRLEDRQTLMAATSRGLRRRRPAGPGLCLAGIDPRTLQRWRTAMAWSGRTAGRRLTGPAHRTL